MSRLFPKIPRDWSADVDPIQSKVFDNTEGGSLRCRETQIVTTYNITVSLPILDGKEAEELREWAADNRTNNVYWNDPKGVERPERWYQCQLIREPVITPINTTWASAGVEMTGRVYSVDGEIVWNMEQDPHGPAAPSVPLGYGDLGRPYYEIDEQGRKIYGYWALGDPDGPDNLGTFPYGNIMGWIRKNSNYYMVAIIGFEQDGTPKLPLL